MARVALVAGINFEPYAYDHRGLVQGLKELNCDYLIADPQEQPDERVLALKIRAFQPDLVVHHLVMCLNGLMPLIGKEIPQIFWMLDYRPEYGSDLENWKDNKEYLRHIFISNKNQIKLWESAFNLPVSYLPHGCYVLPKLEKDEKFYYPCVFMGSMINASDFKNRHDLIEEIKRLIPVSIINSYNQEERNKNWENMAKIYHTSDTVLDVSHFWDNPGYCSGRYFYSSGLGGCAVSKRFPDCEELYPEGIKAYFDSPEEAAEKIKYYQTHPAEREKMKITAYDWNKKHHHYKLRFQEIFRLCDLR